MCASEGCEGVRELIFLVEQNRVKAAKWYREPAAQGMKVALVNLGALYKSGELPEIPQNLEIAEEYFRKSATDNYFTGQYNLATLLRDKKTTESTKEAAQIFKLLADGGDVASAYNYANLLKTDDATMEQTTEMIKYMMQCVNSNEWPTNFEAQLKLQDLFSTNLDVAERLI